MIIRVPVLDVRPQVEGGRLPVKAVVGEALTIHARVFAEARTMVRARVLLTGPDGALRAPVTMHHVDDDHWSAVVVADAVGDWTYAVESWHDPLGGWLRDARLKVDAGVEVELTLADGVAVLERAAAVSPRAADVAASLTDTSLPATERLVSAEHLAATLPAGAVRDHVGSSDPLPLAVDRERALVGSWYELFPRSEGAVVEADGTITPGTLRTAAERLDAIAAMGFDVVYLPPIHPIGTTRRKGRDNSLVAGPSDPGSPWAIGSSAGGHDAVHPDLGTIDDLDAFVARAADLGLDVALDLALQCSPDHPWLVEHPEWFVHRADGTIATAENPPKTYEDIHPLDFDADPEGLLAEVTRVVRHWMAHGIRIFRVDNPHTKPVVFWQRLLADVRTTDADIVFLAEAFTVPAMVHALGAVGFHQGYTYFTWREQPTETLDYLDELSHHSSDVLRPNLFVNTPDILPRYLQGAGLEWFRMRAALAATGSPTWGVYAGFELGENVPAGPDTEEYLHSEKYEVTVRDWSDPRSIAPWLTRLNAVRRAHPALRRLRNLRREHTDTPSVIAYSRRDGDDLVLVVVDLQPGADRVVAVHTDLGDPTVVWRDELADVEVALSEVRLTADHPARILVPVRSRTSDD